MTTKTARLSSRLLRGSCLVAALAAASLLAAPGLAAADDRTDELLRLIGRSKIVDLSHTWEKTSPVASVNPSYEFTLGPTHENTRGTFGDGGQLSFTAEIQKWSGQHGAPSIDAIGHIGRDGSLFGGVDAAASTSNPDGIGASGVGAQLAIDRFPTDLLIGRGVLLDVARMIRKDWSPLPADFEITAAHLEQAAKRQGVKLKRGDVVFIRTGWGQHFKGDPTTYAGPFSPGPGLNGAEFLIKHGARVVGNDTLTFEKRPPVVFEPKFQVFPVHMRMIADRGIYMIENLDLEGLARTGADEFVVVLPPLKISGGTGSALRAFAIVNEKRRHGHDRDRDDD
jgi:kynurenine formamidase